MSDKPRITWEEYRKRFDKDETFPIEYFARERGYMEKVYKQAVEDAKRQNKELDPAWDYY